ncbi:MAG: hypothetical protein LBJ12_00430 [Oscillospiraceae bacterium]|nr:hypothetical protein [Oscillospiraceae bacterium]
MSRILHKMRIPARRTLSGFMSFLMVLSAVVVALPLLMPALQIDAGATYTSSWAGAVTAKNNGDNFRAAQLAAASFTAADVNQGTMTQEITYLSSSGSERYTALDGIVGTNFADTVDEVLSAKGLSGLFTNISYYNNGGADGAPSSTQIIKDAAFSRHGIQWIEDGCDNWLWASQDAWSPTDATYNPSSTRTNTQDYTRDLVTAFKEYDSISQIPDSIDLDGTLSVTHTRKRFATAPSGKYKDDVNDFIQQYIASPDTDYGSVVRVYTDYLSAMSFTAGSTKANGTTIKQWLNWIYTSPWCGANTTVKYLAETYPDVTTLEGLKTTVWDSVRMDAIDNIVGTGMFANTTEATAIFDKYITNSYKADWLKKVDDAIAIVELYEALNQFYTAGADTGYWVSAPTNTFNNGGGHLTPSEATNLAQTIINDQENATHTYDGLNRTGPAKVELDDIKFLYQNALTAYQTLEAARSTMITNSTDQPGKSIFYYIQNFITGYSGFDTTLGQTEAWVYNCNLVYSMWSWAVKKDDIQAFVNAQNPNYPDYHKGVQVDDESNSLWNSNDPDEIRVLDQIDVTDGIDATEEALLHAVYKFSDASLPFSTLNILNLLALAADYNNIVTMLGGDKATLFPDFGKLDTIFRALRDEYSYRVNIYSEILGSKKLPGWEPAWYAYRDWFTSQPSTPQELSAASVSTLFTLFKNLNDKYAGYNTDSDAALSAFTALGRTLWWNEIFEMTTPMTVPNQARDNNYAENNWGKAVPQVMIDNTGYEIAGRLQPYVEQAMEKYAKYDLEGMFEWDGGELKVNVSNYKLAYAIVNMFPQDIIDKFTPAEAVKYINNTNVWALSALPDGIRLYNNSIYGKDGGKYSSVTGRTVIGDYLFLMFVVKAVVDEFQSNPNAYWSQVKWYTGGDQFTGTYATRYGDTVDNPALPGVTGGKDAAREPGEDYVLKGTQLQSLISSLDGMAGSNGDLSKILDALGVDLSSLGVNTSAGPVNANTIIQSALANMVYSNDIVNMLVQLLYGMVLPMFENVFAGLTGGLVLPADLSASSTLHIFSLHSLLANTGSTISNNRTGFATDGSGNIGSFYSLTNANTLSDLRLYPDLLGSAIDATEFAAAANALKNPTGYAISTIDEELKVARNIAGGSSGYKYNIDTWRDPSIFKPTVNADGTITYETDEFGSILTNKPVGKLTLDWGLDNPSLTPAEKAAKFKRAVGNALTGIFPLLQALLLGQRYVGFNPKIGYLNGQQGEDNGWGTYTSGGTDVPMRVSAIYLTLEASGNDGFAKVVTPILEALAGIDTASAQSVYNKIPSAEALRGITYNGTEGTVKDNRIPGWVEIRDQDGDWRFLGSGAAGSNIWHFGRLSYDGDPINTTMGMTGGTGWYGSNGKYANGTTGNVAWPKYTYSADSARTASVDFVNKLFAPVDQLLINVGGKPLNEILRLLPNLSYAVSLDRIAPLLQGTLKTEITPDVNGMIELGTPGGCSSLIEDLANGALTGGSRNGRTPDTAGSSPFAGWSSSQKYSVCMVKDYYLIGARAAGTGTTVMENLVNPLDSIVVDVGEQVDLSSLDQYLKAGSLENLLLGVAPDAATLLPSGLLDITLGMYGPVKTPPEIASKRAGTQTRAYVDTEIPNMFYGILQSVLNPETMGNLGVDFLGDFNTATAIAALAELHAPYTGPAGNGYAMRDVNYGTTTKVYDPFEFRTEHINLDEATGILNKLIAALTGGKLFDLDGMVDKLLGENVYNNATFDLVKDLLLSYIGPEGSFGETINLVRAIVPELDFLKYYSDSYSEATYQTVEPKYETWKYVSGTAGTDGGEFTVAELENLKKTQYATYAAYVFKSSGSPDDPSTPLVDESKICTNTAQVGQPTSAVDKAEHIGLAWNFEVAPDTDSAYQYPTNFWTGITGVSNGVIDSQEGFFNAFYKLLSPLEDFLKTLLFDVDYKLLNTVNGAVVTIPGYNGYEYGFIPLMEGLGFTDGLSSFDQLKNLTGADFIEKLFQPVFNGLGQLASDPITFALTRLPQILFFLFSGSALEDSVRNLLKTPLVLLDTVRPLVSIDISEYFNYLSIDGILSQFGDVLNDALGNLIPNFNLYDFIFGSNAEFLKTLIIGTVKLETSKDGDMKTSKRTGSVFQGDNPSPITMEDGKYPKIDVTVADYFFSIITKVIAYVNTNRSLLDNFLEDESTREIILQVLDKLDNEEGAHALFDVLYQFLYGAHEVVSPSDVYVGYGPIVPRTDIYTDPTSGWTQEKAQKFTVGEHNKELDLVLNAILELILGPGNGTTDIINGFLTGGTLLGNNVMDPPVFSTAFFNKIKALIVGIGSNESLAGIIDIVDDYITTLDIDAFLHPSATLGDDIDAATTLEDKAAAFKAAIVELLDPLAPLFRLLLTNTTLEEIGLYAPGDPTEHLTGCENLIKLSGYYGYIYGLAPVLAAVGVQVPSFDAVNATTNPLDPILDSILDILYDVADHPVSFVLDNLPNILAFIQADAAPKAARQLITPLYAIAVAVNPIVKDIDIGGTKLDIIAMVDDVMNTLDLKTLIDDFLSLGIDLGNGSTLDLGSGSNIFSKLIVGTKGAQKDKANTQLIVPTGNYEATRVDSNKGDALTALVEFVVSLTDEPSNLAAIAELLGGEIPPFVLTVIKNVQDHPQTLLNILYTLRFGADVEAPADVWSGYGSIHAQPFSPYVDSFSYDKANALVQGLVNGEHGGTLAGKKEFDLILNWVLKFLDVKDLQGDPVNTAGDLIDSVLGEYLYSPSLFEQIVAALQSIASNPTITSILDIVKKAVPDLDIENFLKADVDLTGLSDPDVAVRKQAFIDALRELLEPIAPLLNVFLAGESLDTLDIDNCPESDHVDPLIKLSGSYGYNYGVVPLLEALGCDPAKILSYTEYQTKAGISDPVTPLIESILALVETIAENPVDWALTNLPNIIAFTGDSASLFKVLNALLAPVYALVNAVTPLLIDVEVDILGNTVVIDENTAQDLLGSLLPSLNVSDILQNLLGKGIDISGKTFNIDVNALVAALLVGKVESYASKSVDVKDSTVLTGQHVVADKPGLLTSLVSFLFEAAAVSKDDLLDLLGINLTAPLDTILNNTVAHPQAVLNLIYHVKFGTGLSVGDLNEVYANYDVYTFKDKVKPYNNYNSVWTQTMAEHLVLANANNSDDLAVIADSIVKYLTGKTLGKTIEDIFGQTVYNPELFQKIVDAIDSVLDDPNLADILNTVDTLLDDIDLAALMDTTRINVAETNTEAGFKVALNTLLEPIAPLLKVFLAGESYKTIGIDSGNPDDTLITISGYAGYVYGIAPILEAFGATAPDYTVIQGAANPLSPIIDALLNLVADITADPVDWVLTNLPNIAAFIETGTLNKALEQLLKPVIALVDTVKVIFTDVDLEVAGITIDLSDLAGSLLSSLDLKKIADDFLAPGIDIGGQKLTLDTQGFIDALLVGTLNGHNVTADKPGLFTGLVEYLLGTTVVANKDAIAGLLGGTISEPINGILTNATTNPKVVLRILYNFFYGTPNAQDYIVYDDGRNLGISAGGSAIYREEWWTRNHAKYVWDRADDFVNKVWAILFGKPLGSIKGELDGLTGQADTFLSDLLGQALFTQENLTLIVNLVKDNVPDGILQTDVLGTPLAQLIKKGVFINGKNGPEALDLEAILAPFEEYAPALYPVTDRDSFIAQLVKLLTPAVPVLDVLLAGSDINIVPRTELGPDNEGYVVNVYGADGYKYGLLPLLEAIGIGIDKDAYLARIDTPDQFANKQGADKLYAILNPLLWVLEQVVSNPIENILRIVPNLIYTIDGTNLQSCVNKLLEPVNDVLESIDGLYHIDPIAVSLDIPTLLNGVLSGTGLEITYDSLKALLIGDLVPYASKNSAADAKYISVDSTINSGENFMPDMLTVVLRFIVMTFVATKNNQQIVLDYLVNHGLKGATYTFVSQTVNDIFTFIREGDISDIHGRYVLGADIFLNAAFILIYGMDKVVCRIYDVWQNVNEKITQGYKHLLESNNAYDNAYAKNAAAFTNKYFPAIVTIDPKGNGTVAPSGFIQFWLTIVAWFKKIFSFLF